MLKNVYPRIYLEQHHGIAIKFEFTDIGWDIKLIICIRDLMYLLFYAETHIFVSIHYGYFMMLSIPPMDGAMLGLRMDRQKIMR